MQDFDFWLNLIIFIQILSNLSKFYSNFTQIGLNFAQICLEKYARRCGRAPSSYATERRKYSIL